MFRRRGSLSAAADWWRDARRMLSYLFYRPSMPGGTSVSPADVARDDAADRRARHPRTALAPDGVSCGDCEAAAGLRGRRWHRRRSKRVRPRRPERRYIDVARFMGGRTTRAPFPDVQHSVSLRLYADRLTLRSDMLDRWLDRTRRVSADRLAGGRISWSTAGKPRRSNSGSARRIVRGPGLAPDCDARVDRRT